LKIHLDLDSEPGIVIGHASGSMTLADMRDAAHEAWARASGPRARFLWDIREAEFDLPADQVRELAEYAKRTSPFPDLRTAFVVREGLQFGLVRMFEVMRETPGARVRVFTEADPALDWLRSETS
jgi:hypothetical protein